MINDPVHRTRRRFLRVVGAVGAGGLLAVGTATAEKPENHEGRILTVNDDGESGRLERTSDNKEFHFTIPNGRISVEPGDMVAIIIDTGGTDERAIVINTGGSEE